MIAETVQTFIHLEEEWDQEKMEKRVWDYFNKAYKDLDFKKSVQEIIDDYARIAFSKMFASLGDRKWLQDGGVDFSLVLMAGCKDAIPAEILNTVSFEDFQQIVINANAVRFDDERFEPILWQAVNDQIQGPKIRKKVGNAFSEGRKKAFASGAETVDDFATAWIKESLTELAAQEWGGPKSVIEEAECCALFTTLIQGNALPIAITQESDTSLEFWPVEETVASIYLAAEAGELELPAKKKARKK